MYHVHELKSWPKFFQPLSEGTRTHELRKNDRRFKIGDRLLLREYDPELGYLGSMLHMAVTSMTSYEQPCAVSSMALHTDYCILSVSRVFEDFID